MRNKIAATAAAAVADIPDGSRIAVGGFGICGTPFELIRALLAAGTSQLHIVANNCGLENLGLGQLLQADRIRKVTCSYVGSNPDFARRILRGEIEIDPTPQGTLAERLRAAGSGLPAFYTPTGAGTNVATGGIPTLYRPDGSIAQVSSSKETRTFGGVECVLETALHCDYALVRAHRGDSAGNLVFRRTAQNFNPVCAMAATVAIAEVEHLVDVGTLDPDGIHLPGIFVDRIVQVVDHSKPIERVTVRTDGGPQNALHP